ncbi:hypothetical protein [Vibrio vulnificus YJ016]|uniref:Uncharacterized protein n=1 Tax=Vibrio vulnificus (strain YJ016) TaxID=196600 RepID=Q7MCZ6_VIBVY|nr:hypothetical protein [Vibrio vulnificus YJ016]
MVQPCHGRHLHIKHHVRFTTDRVAPLHPIDKINFLGIRFAMMARSRSIKLQRQIGGNFFAGLLLRDISVVTQDHPITFQLFDSGRHGRTRQIDRLRHVSHRATCIVSQYGEELFIKFIHFFSVVSIPNLSPILLTTLN